MIPLISNRKKHLIGRTFIVGFMANLLGCAVPNDTPLVRQARIEGLSNEIQRVCGPVDKATAKRVAEKAVLCSAKRRVEWDVLVSPWIHNALVNGKIEKYGLCYHWANAIWLDVSGVLPRQLKMTLIETRPTYFSLGHHVISLHRADGYWTEGVILDGWKGGGMLDYEELSTSRREWRFEDSTPYWSPD